MDKVSQGKVMAELLRRLAREEDCCMPIPPSICNLRFPKCHTCPYYDIDRHADYYVDALVEQAAKDLETLAERE